MANKRFKYEIKLFKLHIPNSKEEIFKNEVMNIPYLLYEVEELSNENKIVINKPGGKRNFGRLSRNDLMVFIYYTKEKELWLISHKEIENDLINKSKSDKNKTTEIVLGLKRVCLGEEPSEVLKSVKDTQNLPGIPVETIYKAYKWIWGQEDCNYPKGKGRWLSMNNILKIFNIPIK